MKLIRDIGFDQSYSFVYSARPGTPAASMDDDTPLEVKKERLQRLQELINSQARAISEAMLGGIQRILVEGASTKDASELKGRTENNRVVNFKGAADLIGQFIDVRITEVRPNSLRGEVI
jgi:tRNA-2-methylthio-N6-dimethylallyladenosine synthase